MKLNFILFLIFSFLSKTLVKSNSIIKDGTESILEKLDYYIDKKIESRILKFKSNEKVEKSIEEIKQMRMKKK